MKFSAQWLREWVNPAVDIDTLSAQLTMAGLEVDAVAPVAEAFSGVLVGEVLQVEQHPDADKLRVCLVNIGGGAPLNFVCGAANVRVGLRVPTATIGAVLPGDFRIKRSKLRGVESCGMLCSAKELGLAESSDGLLELPADAPVGQDLRAYLHLDDGTFELGGLPALCRSSDSWPQSAGGHADLDGGAPTAQWCAQPGTGDRHHQLCAARAGAADACLRSCQAARRHRGAPRPRR